MTPFLVQLLRDALDLEFADRPRVAALATVDHDRRPHCRHVIVRNLLDDGTFWVASDGRSRKIPHLRDNPHAELAFWLPARREQFRVTCDTQVLGRGTQDPRWEKAWAMLNDATRALFAWPAPGRPRGDCDVDFVQSLPPDTPIPDSFELIILLPRELDHLQLSPFPHQRTRYRAENAWQAEDINP